MPSKKLFGKTIQTVDDGIQAYPKDISLMFRWMQNIKLKRCPTIIDIGANNGLYSLSYASMFPGAEIHSFEPIPFIYNYLKRNLEINPTLSSNIHAHNLGMSNKEEQLQLSIPVPEQHERYSKETDIRHYSALGKGDEKFEAQFITLDRWVDVCKINSLDFIKIDTEGYELSILEGASKTLKSFKPIVMFELNQLTLTLSQTKADTYLLFSRDLGYNIFGLEYGYKSELLSINSVEQVSLISDIILLPS